MNKLSIFSLTLAAALAAPIASAGVVFNSSTAPSGAHLSQGSPQPSCTVDPATLIVSCNAYQIGGVGNTDANLVLSATYSATVTCTNNGGKLVNVKTQTTVANSGDALTDLRNGTLYVSAISVKPPTTQAFLDAATCPNGNWTKNLANGSPALSSFSYSLTFVGYPAPAVSFP
ncbi:hypothetical protein JOD97_004267 [Duganella sp. 1411]|uniref:hypothetical protein n=1 Tax=Duganella sp. 1411 TaxID=2806572 RepID=UPI001AEB7054|nr:hypothetical protein [Duganella sp. 1411]MBP1206194.1 hypothetical protein [Duganella sp. 1411]